MRVPRSSFVALTVALTMSLAIASPALSQSGGNNAKPPEQKTGDGQPPKDGQGQTDEIAEAAKALTGPAGNPECVWLGRRVVSLLWRDDLDTAFRHLDLYDRFSCPSSHIQATFRCIVRQGYIDPKSQESLNGRVHACWVNPQLEPPPPAQPAAAQPGQAAQPAPAK